tara:strand:- start:20116 stop:26193 length:6078 start_codon:yes stop_codon:yes gene_type:complete
MGCQIKYNSEQNKYDVTTPDGESSILFNTIASLPGIQDQHAAMYSYTKINTPTFKEWYGLDWESISDSKKNTLIKQGYLDLNGEPAIFYQGDFTGSESFNYSDSVGRFKDNVYLTNNRVEAETFAKKTGAKLFPIFLKPGPSVQFKNVISFQKAVSEFNNIEAAPSEEHIKKYVDSIHQENKTIIGNGVMGFEYNSPNKSDVKSIFPSSFNIEKGLMFENTLTENEFLDEATQEEAKMDDFLGEFVSRLANNLGLDETEDVFLIDETEAYEITKGSINPYSEQPAFFYKGKVYLVKGKISYETALHEFAHPLVRAILKDNKVLFERIYSDIITDSQGARFLAEAISEYPELNASNELIKEEVIVKAITFAAKTENLINPEARASKGVMAAIKKFFYAVKQMLRKVFGKGVKNLNYNTTAKDLAKSLIDDTWNINFETVSEEDVVAYMNDLKSWEDDMVKANTKKGKKHIYQLVLDNISIYKKQLAKMRSNPNKEDIKIVLSTETGDEDYQQMVENMSAFNQESKLQKAYSERIDALDDYEERIKALYWNASVLDGSLDRISEYLENMTDQPNQSKALHQIQFFTESMEQWKTYLMNFLESAKENGVSGNSAIVGDLSRIKEKIDRTQSTVSTIYENAVTDVLYEMVPGLNADILKTAQVEIDKAEKIMAKSKPDSLTYKTASTKKDTVIKERDEAHITKDKMRDWATGKMGDIGQVSAWLENYVSMQDPSISSFAMYVKKNLSEVSNTAHANYNELLTKLEPLIKELGVKPSQIDKFSENFIFVDKSVRRNEETQELEEYEVYTFLNEFENYKYTTAMMSERVKKAEEILFTDSSNKEAKQEYINAVSDKMEHEKYFFHKTFTDDYYYDDDILDNSDIGRKAKKLRSEKLQLITEYSKLHNDNSELYENFETLDLLWKDYSQLYSLYDEYGVLKVDDEENGTYDLTIAKLLREHREAKKHFYKYEKMTGKFQMAYQHFIMKEGIKLENKGLVKGSDAYNTELKTKAKLWEDRNTRVKIKNTFYEDKAKIVDRIKSIMESAGRKSGNYDVEYETIMETLKGKKDDNGQPVATEMTPELLSNIKDLEQKIQDGKDKLIEESGLTSNEWAMLKDFYTKIEQRVKFNDNERSQFNKLKDKKNKLGISKTSKTQLLIQFQKLNDLQTKVATDYYINIVNEFYGIIQQDTNQKDPIDITNENVNMFLGYDFVQKLFKQNSEFETWFKNNHIEKEIFNWEMQDTEKVYMRTAAWSVIKPNDPKYYETTVIQDSEGKDVNIDGIPSMKYYKRLVKDEYRTGYDSATGTVKLKVGEHISRAGLTTPDLPYGLKKMEELKDKYSDKYAEQDYAWDYYINKDYQKLKNEGGAKYETLELLKKFHLDSQIGLERNGLLGLEFPRYRKDRYEYLASGSLKKDASNKFKEIKDGLQQFWGKRRDDYENELNYDAQAALADIDLYEGVEGKVPVSGKYNMDINQVSRDMITRMMQYHLSAEQNKQLRKVQPIARAFQKLAVDNNPSDMEALKKMSANQRVVGRVKSKNSNNRAKVINSIVETFFEGKRLFEGSSGKHSATTIKLMNNALGMASHAFFAFDVTSAMKNFLGAQFQIALEGTGSKHFRYSDFHAGRPWALNAMTQISLNIHSTTAKPLNVQIIEIFDAIQGRFQSKFGESPGRSVMRDFVSGSWMTSHRKWLETEATLQLFSALMHGTKVEQVIDGEVKKIKYINAWEINENTKSIQLKEGIDKKWDMDGEKFNELKFKNHEISNFLQGAYSDFDQPMVNRALAWKMVSSMRKFFTKMFLNRYGYRGNFLNPQERYNLPTNSMHMGFYMRNIATMLKIAKSRGKYAMMMSKDEKRAATRGLVELIKIWLLQATYMWIWGFDPDDEDKWKKIRDRSGALPTPFTDEEWSENWNMSGWLANHTLLLAMHVEAENVHFIPWPGYGMSDMINLFSTSSIAATPSIGTLTKIFKNLTYAIGGDESAYYKQDTGALNVRQEGEWKGWVEFYKMLALKGKMIDPGTSIKNFSGMRKNQK